MTIPVPSLSSRGWATDISDKADLLLSYYFTSDYLQSVAWVGAISSFHEQLEKNQHSVQQLQTSVESRLEDYLGRYFDSVDITVTVSVPDSDKPNELSMEFYVNVQQGENTYSLGRVVETKDTTIQSIFDLNNG